MPKKLADRPGAIRRYVVDELHRKIDAEPRPNMTDETPEPDETPVPPAPEPDDEPADQHDGPLDDDEDARNLDPVDPRRREVERRRGRPFSDDDELEAG